jgi:hypothetical protein
VDFWENLRGGIECLWSLEGDDVVNSSCDEFFGWCCWFCVTVWFRNVVVMLGVCDSPISGVLGVMLDAVVFLREPVVFRVSCDLDKEVPVFCVVLCAKELDCVVLGVVWDVISPVGVRMGVVFVKLNNPFDVLR